MDWDPAFEATCQRLIAGVCDGGAPRAARDRAWRELLVRIGPHVERWASTSALLRRAGLGGEDDARAVLVATLERLASGDFDNLRGFLARRAPAGGDDLDALVRLAAASDDEDGGVEARGTPLRAWLITLVGYVERDHVRARLGWSAGGGDKRDVNSHAARFPTDGGPVTARPPITDALTAAQVMAEVRRYLATFPDGMRAAVELWMADTPFDEIAERLALGDAARARALVRAGQARLRERFRADLPPLG